MLNAQNKSGEEEEVLNQDIATDLSEFDTFFSRKPYFCELCICVQGQLSIDAPL
jgi:hypothetical protein